MTFVPLYQNKCHKPENSTANVEFRTYGDERHGLVVGPDQVGPEDHGQVGCSHLVHITSVNHL